jgi:hypothetical protein
MENVSNGLCACGCGGITPVWKRTYTCLGVRKGEHYKFIRGHHLKNNTNRRSFTLAKTQAPEKIVVDGSECLRIPVGKYDYALIDVEDWDKV